MAWSIVSSVWAIATLIAATLAPNVGAPSGLEKLGAAEIRKALRGKSASYSPAGWADAGLYEEYHGDGTWRGFLLGRGPIKFAGRWIIKNNELCVTADPGTIAARWHAGEYCRPVWRDRETAQLRMNYLADQPSSSHSMGMQTLRIRDLDTPKQVSIP